MRGALLGLAALAGCQSVTLVGEVRSDVGAPVAGAVLSSPGCEAVSGADGRFRVACEHGTRTFTVSHPDHLSATWPVEPAGRIGEQDLGGVRLATIPLDAGLWLASDAGLLALPAAAFLHTAGAEEQRWCIDGAATDPVPVAGRAVRLLDNHAYDWRLYRMDTDGCAYRMRRTGGEAWSFVADRVEVPAALERGPGRGWLELSLEPGDYALLEWYDGFLVREEADRYRGHWLRVGG